MRFKVRSAQGIQRPRHRRFAAVLTAGALLAAFVAVPSAAWAEIAPTDPVVFGDSGLETCVTEALSIAAGGIVTHADLGRLTSLDCQEVGISELSALQFATSLTNLNLAGNAIADVSALAALTTLTNVVLTDQLLALPDTTAGQASDFPAVRDTAGSAVAVEISADSESAGSVVGNAVTWACAGTGRLGWLATVAVGNTGTSATFSGTMLQQVTPGAIPACLLTSTPTPVINGTPRSGQTLTVAPGNWAPMGVNLKTQWKRAGYVISGATTGTYVVLATDAGKAITVTVTGSKSGYATTARTSAAATIEKSLTATPAPTISGARRVGQILTATAGAWAPMVVTFSYAWKRNGTAISGATNSAYKLVAADAGTKITVVVTGRKTGYTAASRASDGTWIEKLLTASPVPVISGTSRVGKTLTAKPGTWSPSTVTLAYRWKRDGAGILGATAPTYTLVKADAGRLITVTVVGSKSGYTTTSRTSAALRIEKLLTTAPIPTVSGSAATGKRLTANAGTWGPSPVTLTYQWQRDGMAISGATSSTYVSFGSDIGKRISVVVRGSKAGYTSASRASASTAAIVLSIAIPGDGVYRVGSGLAPGTYVTKGATDFCYWARLSGFDDSLDSIISNDIGFGQRIVTISASDVGFETSRCGSWIRLSDKATTVRSTIADEGVFDVDRQIKPGLYRAPGGDGCYWASLSSYDGDLNSIIDNDFSYYTGQYVQVYDWFAGLETSGCGIWTRIGD